MSETKFTPAPWTTRERYRNCYAIVVDDGDGNMQDIAWLGESSNQNEGENFANARLISYAPELLDALESAVKMNCGNCCDAYEPNLCRINKCETLEYKKLIAKAKGDNE